MKTRIMCALLLLCGIATSRPCLAQTQAANDAIPTQLTAAIRADVAEKYAQMLSERYVYVDKGAKMAAAIRARLQAGAYDKIISPWEFARALAADARAVVNDGHLNVFFSATPAGGHGPMMMMRRGGQPSAQMLAESARANGGIVDVRILDGNIGYMEVNIMALQDENGKAAIAAAFAFLRNTDAIILDLRGNTGGSGYAELFMSYFSEGAPITGATAYWREGDTTREQVFRTTDLGPLSYGAKKPLYVLTSHRTFSAAEGLAYEIQGFKRGTIVGETTGGGANPTNDGNTRLGYGFSAFVPTGYVVSAATGTNWEGVGVKPDVDVPASEALGKAWSLAAEKLAAIASDPAQQTLLSALAAARLSGEPSLTAEQAAGVYGAPGKPQFEVVVKDGRLYYRQRQPYPADFALTAAGGDHYRLDEFPDDFSMTFFMRDGKVQMIPMLPGIHMSTPVQEKQ